jgi:hypothetical protein
MKVTIILFLAIVSILFFIVIMRLIRRNLLPPSSTLMWALIGVLFFSLPFLNDFYRYVAVKILGFADATNIIYIFSIGFLMLYSLYLTVKLKLSSDRIQVLISQQAIIEAEVNARLSKLEKKNRK